MAITNCDWQDGRAVKALHSRISSFQVQIWVNCSIERCVGSSPTPVIFFCFFLIPAGFFWSAGKAIHFYECEAFLNVLAFYFFFRSVFAHFIPSLKPNFWIFISTYASGRHVRHANGTSQTQNNNDIDQEPWMDVCDNTVDPRQETILLHLEYSTVAMFDARTAMSCDCLSADSSRCRCQWKALIGQLVSIPRSLVQCFCESGAGFSRRQPALREAHMVTVPTHNTLYSKRDPIDFENLNF